MVFDPWEMVVTVAPGAAPNGVSPGVIDWDATKRAILEGLDVAAEYAALGVEFTREGPNGRGLLECRAMGREDRNPSAFVNPETGVYHDSGGEGVTLDLFEFALRYGEGCGRWIDALRHYAGKAGVEVGRVPTRSGGRILEDRYDYRDAEGEVRYAVFRYRFPNGKKSFTQHPSDGLGGWRYGAGCMDGVSPLPYRLPELLAAPADETVWVVEGEKDCRALAAFGLVATTNHGGANATARTWPHFLEHFRGRRVAIVPDHDTAGRSHASRVAGLLRDVAASVKVVELPGLGPGRADHGLDVSDWLDGTGTVEELLQRALEAPEWHPGEGPGPAGPEADPTAADLGIVWARDVEETSVQWLWKYRLARRSMALLAGDGGIGKSQVLLAVAAAVTTGGPWPDGSGNAPVGSVAILSAEDRADTTLKPRLMALGADLDRVAFLTAKHVVRKEGEEPKVGMKSFQDLDYWRLVFEHIPDCKLLIVDPVPSYLGRGVNDSRNSEIRAVLEPFLDEIAGPFDFCVFCNTHLNKSTGAKNPVDRILGSVAYVNLARNVHIVVRDAEDPTLRYFSQPKCNDAPDDLPSMAFRVERREVLGRGGEVIETAIPVFQADLVEIDLRALVNGDERRGPKPEKSTRFATWLLERLRGGPVPIVDLVEEARQEGLLKPVTDQEPKPSISPLYHARDRLPTLDPGSTVEQIEVPRGSKTLKHWQLVHNEGGAEFPGVPF